MAMWPKVLTIGLFATGIIVEAVLVLSHPGSGPYICNPAACEPNPNYTPPGAGPRSPTVQPFTPVDPPTTGPDAWWLRADACHLLTTSQVRSLGLAKPADAAGPHEGCIWGSRYDGMTISLLQYSYAQIGPDHGRPFRSGDGRPGVIAAGPAGCQLMLQATKGSTAYIYVTTGPHARQCQTAAKAANMISPELPPSGITR
jgi:hypothetical protein